MKKIALFLLFSFFLFSSFAKQEDPGIGIGSDAAYPFLEPLFKNIPLKENSLYTTTDEEVKLLIDKSSEIGINIFELLDCACRYLVKNKYRIKVLGTSLTALQSEYTLIHIFLDNILPFEKIESIEAGYCFNTKQNALDVFLDSTHNATIEMGTCYYEKHFGFRKVEPLLFSECFGLTVKVWGIKRTVTKLHLYDRGKGSFFVKNFFIGKHYYIGLIKKN